MSAPDFAETVGELRELLFDLRQQAQDTGYGVFPGGDPRTFTPDPECSTAEEQQAWKDDCARAERGEKPVTKTACEWLSPEVHVMRKGYGLGTYTMEDPQAADWAERLERAIGALDSWHAELEGP